MSALNARNFKMQKFCTIEWRAIAPVGTTVEKILEPSFWAHVASQPFSQFDKIEVLSEGGVLDVELRVVGVGQQALHVRLIRDQRAAPVVVLQGSGPVAAPGEPRTEFTPADKWRVVDATGAVVAKGLRSVEEADAALADHLTKLAA